MSTILLPDTTLGRLVARAYGEVIPERQHLAHPHAGRQDTAYPPPLCGAVSQPGEAFTVLQMAGPLLWPGAICQGCYAHHLALCGIDAY